MGANILGLGQANFGRRVGRGLLAGLIATQAISPPLSVAAALATQVLRLPSLLIEARDNNPDVRSARKRWQAARARIPQAKGLPAPRVGIEFEEIPRGSVKFNQATILYSLIQSLPFPGKLSLRHQVAVKESQVAAMAFKQTEWDVMSQLKTAYYELFLLDRELEIQQGQRTWVEQAVGTAEARYATGAGSQTELLQLQGEALRAANQTEVLTHRRQETVAHLNHFLNRPIEQPLGPPDAIPLLPVPSSPEALLAEADELQPELLAFKYSAERATAAWRLSKRELLPDLETMVELRDPAMGPFGPWDLTLALVLPFWFWTKAKYGVKGALHDKESAEAAYEAMRNEIAVRIHEHWHEAQAAYSTAKLCQDRLIELARQATASALAAYQSGRGSFLNVLEALRNLGEQQRTYYQHLASLEQRLVLLEQAVGKPLRPPHETSVTSGQWSVVSEKEKG